MNANVWSNIFFLSPYKEGSYIPTLETTVFENGNLLKILMRGETRRFNQVCYENYYLVVRVEWISIGQISIG